MPRTPVVQPQAPPATVQPAAQPANEASTSNQADEQAPVKKLSWFTKRTLWKVIGLATKIILARELLGSAIVAYRSYRDAQNDSEYSDSSYEDTEEEALDTVAEYLRGKAGLGALKAFTPQQVLGALKQVDAEALEELGASRSSVQALRATMEATVTALEKQQAEAAAAPASARSVPKMRGTGDRVAYLVRRKHKPAAATDAAAPSGS